MTKDDKREVKAILKNVIDEKNDERISKLEWRVHEMEQAFENAGNAIANIMQIVTQMQQQMQETQGNGQGGVIMPEKERVL